MQKKYEIAHNKKERMTNRRMDAGQENQRYYNQRNYEQNRDRSNNGFNRGGRERGAPAGFTRGGFGRGRGVPSNGARVGESHHQDVRLDDTREKNSNNGARPKDNIHRGPRQFNARHDQARHRGEGGYAHALTVPGQS